VPLGCGDPVEPIGGVLECDIAGCLRRGVTACEGTAGKGGAAGVLIGPPRQPLSSGSPLAQGSFLNTGPAQRYNYRVRAAVAEAWVLVRILLRFVAVGILAWVVVTAVSHSGLWYGLAIPLGVLALGQLVISGGLLWVWARELRSVDPAA
jgi:hypothetical protein